MIRLPPEQFLLETTAPATGVNLCGSSAFLCPCTDKGRREAWVPQFTSKCLAGKTETVTETTPEQSEARVPALTRSKTTQWLQHSIAENAGSKASAHIGSPLSQLTR